MVVPIMVLLFLGYFFGISV